MNIGDFEELILLAIRQLGEGAYGASIREAILAAGRKCAVGAIYITLNRLEAKDLIEGREGEEVPEGEIVYRRGGKVKRYFRITEKAIFALEQAEARRCRLKALLSPVPVKAKKEKYIALMVDLENMGKEQETVSALLMVHDGAQLLGHGLEVWDGPRETWKTFREKWQNLGALMGLEVEVWRPEWWPD
jgi:PadR family transcriptional regulator PadR